GIFSNLIGEITTPTGYYFDLIGRNKGPIGNFSNPAGKLNPPLAHSLGSIGGKAVFTKDCQLFRTKTKYAYRHIHLVKFCNLISEPKMT
ncbi:hypothetical protein, partial [Sunxiuqinia rutila]|uniref:hypothetical protein n=1 Tax=Sunxiuqinia rutila TaxID=1397841 RepID=UPI003D36C978